VNINEAIDAGNRWVEHARPIARKYLALEDVAFFSDVICDHHHKSDAYSKAMVRDYREAETAVKEAQSYLHEMLDGIRDNYRCDYSESFPLNAGDISDSQWDQIEEFNEELDRSMTTVEQLIKMVEDEG